jgi:tRNA dimethylallyltransferase
MPAYESTGQVRPAIQIGLTLPRPELDVRIAARVDRMWQAGLETEVTSLDAQGLREGRTASRALGYQQLLRYLDGEFTLEQARAETIKATRRFARRQESWFRRDPRIHWLNATASSEHLLAEAKRLLP